MALELTLCLVSPLAIIHQQIKLLLSLILLFSSPPTSLEYLGQSGHEVCVTPAGVLRQTLGDGESPLKGQTQLEVSFCRKQQLNSVWRGAIQTALIMLWVGGVYISADDTSFSWPR